MTNDELLLQLVREIHDDQKEVVKSITDLTIAHSTLKAELEAGRNGYSPHEVVELLHWVEKQKNNEQTQSDNIKSAFTNWLVPIIASALVIGLAIMTKYI